MLGAGGYSWESTRVDPLSANAQDLRASGHGTSSLAGAGMRWPLPVGGMVVQPYARVLWQRSARGSFDEGTSPDALSAPGYAATGLRSLAGISCIPRCLRHWRGIASPSTRRTCVGRLLS